MSDDEVVLQAGADRSVPLCKCAVVSCRFVIPADRALCLEHWSALPGRLRTRLADAFDTENWVPTLKFVARQAERAAERRRVL